MGDARDEFDDSLVLYTLDAINSENRWAFLDKGCRILVESSKIKTNINNFEEYLKNDRYYSSEYHEYYEFNKGKISNKDFIEHEYKFIENDSKFKEYFIIGKDIVYSVLITININDSCQNDIDKIVSEIKIK
jgi:hypothetical protein